MQRSANDSADWVAMMWVSAQPQTNSVLVCFLPALPSLGFQSYTVKLLFDPVWNLLAQNASVSRVLSVALLQVVSPWPPQVPCFDLMLTTV